MVGKLVELLVGCLVVLRVAMRVFGKADLLVYCWAAEKAVCLVGRTAESSVEPSADMLDLSLVEWMAEQLACRLVGKMVVSMVVSMACCWVE